MFKWYSRAVFNNYLSRMQTSEAACSERECMLALAAVSDELKKYPMVQSFLVPYAGPQCYPHLDPQSPDYRVDVRQAGEGTGAESAQRESGARQIDEGCWLQCDRCSRWRLVEWNCLLPNCLPT